MPKREICLSSSSEEQEEESQLSFTSAREHTPKFNKRRKGTQIRKIRVGSSGGGSSSRGRNIIPFQDLPRSRVTRKQEGKENSPIIQLDHHNESQVSRAPAESKPCETDDESDMEVPYTQNLGLENDAIQALELSGSKKEPLRPGDIILYTHPMYVCGNRDGLRITQVLNTDPSRDVPLELDNGEILEKDTHVKRIKEYKNGTLIDHPGVSRPIENFRFGKKSLTKADAEGLPGLRRQVERLREHLTQARAEMQTIPENLDMSDSSSSSDESSTESDSVTATKPTRKASRRESPSHSNDTSVSSKRKRTASTVDKNDSDLDSESDLASLSNKQPSAKHKSTTGSNKAASKRQGPGPSSTPRQKNSDNAFDSDSDSDLSSRPRLPSSTKRMSTSSAKRGAVLESSDSDGSLLNPVLSKASRTQNKKDNTDFDSSDEELDAGPAASSTKRGTKPSRASRWGPPLQRDKPSSSHSNTESRHSKGLSFSKHNTHDKPAQQTKSGWLSTSRNGSPRKKPKTSPWSAPRTDSPPAPKRLPVSRSGRSFGIRKESPNRQFIFRREPSTGQNSQSSQASGSERTQKRKILESPDSFSGGDQDPLSLGNSNLFSKSIDLTNSSDSDDALPSSMMHLLKEDARKNVKKNIEKLVSRNKSRAPSPPQSKKENKSMNRTRSQRMARASVFRPTELESDDHQAYGCFDSSDDESLSLRRKRGPATKYLSATKEDRGYSSISSAFSSQNSCEPRESARKKTPLVQQRQSIGSAASKLRISANSNGSMQLSFQPVPRSGSRFD